MPLILSGEKFHDDLYKYGCIAVFAPLEGGYECFKTLRTHPS